MCPASFLSLGEVVRSHLRSVGKTQKVLAKALSVSTAELSKRLSAQKAMQDIDIVRLAEELHLPVPRLLLLGAVARCLAREREVAKKLQSDGIALATKDVIRDEIRLNSSARRIYEELLSQADFVISETSCDVKDYVSLEDFPTSFKDPNWVVLVGDRREWPPLGLGDMVGLSVASTDFMFLNRVPLPWDSTIIRSDKILAIADSDRLKRLLRSNLLVIGSPAVNLGTRFILREVGATFMFNIDIDHYQREQALFDQVGHDATPEDIQDFISQKKVKEELFDLLNTFRKNGFFDPIEFKAIRGCSVPKHIDYGMIALTRNPWSGEHFACICAGVHGGGTAGALELLSSPESFSEHPWGGVFRVSMSDQLPWETRFGNLAPRWETHPYKPTEYLENIDDLINKFDALVDRGTSSQKEASVKAVRDMLISKSTLINVRNLASELASKLETQS